MPALFAKVVAARQEILGHDIFRIEPYKKAAYQGCKAIAEPFFVAGFNIWKIDWLYLACPHCLTQLEGVNVRSYTA
eukprot:6469683-Amphidinium_carterae.1